MNVNKAEELLARYYEGQTSEAEELALKRFFAENEVPEHLQCDKMLFLGMDEEVEVPQGLEERLSKAIDELARRKQQTVAARKPGRIIPLRWIGSVAACLIVAFAVGTYFATQPSVPKDTCATPEEAYEYTYHALAQLYTTLNRGFEEIETAQERAGAINALNERMKN